MTACLNEIIKEIQETSELSAECRNALHGATEGHPWAEGKDFSQRKLEARVALAGRKIDLILMHKLDTAKF